MPDTLDDRTSDAARNPRRISGWHNSAYALGDAGFNFYWTTVETFLFFFYTDVYRLPTASLALTVLLARGIDLVAGPAIGIIADRTHSKLGHYRPYLLAFSLPLGASFAALFCAPSTWPQLAQSRFPALTATSVAELAIICFTLFYASANIPYTALLAVITTDSAEKRKLSALRFAAAAAAVLTVQFATLPLVQRLGQGDAARGWQRVALLYALLASTSLLCCFSGVREVAASTQRIHLRTDVPALLRTRRWYVLMATTAFALAALTCRGGVTLYYMRYVIERQDLTNLFLVANSAAALGACLLASWLPARFVSPRTLLPLCSVGGILSSISLLYDTPHRLVAAFIGQTLFGLCTGALLPAIFALFADLPFDSLTLRGRSINGTVAATSLIALKCGGLAGAAILAVSLARMGYLPNQVQPLSVRHAIVILISLVPAVFLFLCWLSSRWVEERPEAA